MTKKASRGTAPSRRTSAGARLRAAVRRERPLQVAGVINALAASLAARSGFQALYLSGAGVANASYGVPDVGLTSGGGARKRPGESC